jgi:hypothetical protein
MTALPTVTEFCRELERRHVPHEFRIVRHEALMLSVAVPGERSPELVADLAVYHG